MRTTLLGWAKVYRLPDGEQTYDKHSLRADSIDGDDFGGDDYGDDDFGDEDYGDDDFGDDELADDEAGDDDFGDDELADDEAGDDGFGDDELADDEAGDDVGASPVGGRKRRRTTPRERMLARKLRRAGNNNKKLAQKARRAKAVKWIMTAVSASATAVGAAASITATLTPATWLKLQDITFTGTTAGTVKSITVGDKLVWSSSTGVPCSIFGSTGFLRNMLRGTVARPGVPILIDMISGAAETITATIIAKKPASRC